MLIPSKRCCGFRWFSSRFPAFYSGTHLYTLKQGEKIVQIRTRHPNRSSIVQKFFDLRLNPLIQVHPLTTSNKSSSFAPLKACKMSDSFCQVSLPFLHNPQLAEDYKSIYGGIRVGKILEDLDALAAAIAYLHCGNLDITIVTAAVDRIDLLRPLQSIMENVRLGGSVTYVGHSSMEVTVSVESTKDPIEDDNTIKNSTRSARWELAALAKFIMVARTPDGSHPVQVPRLILETPSEKETYAYGEERTKWRKSRDENSLYRQPPTEQESRLVHDLFLNAPNGGVPMKSTLCNSILMCQPQERNIHNFMFGGYLMREAYEVAYSAAFIFFKNRPTFKSLDDISFVHPVAIGSILDFTSTVVYSVKSQDNRHFCHVEVKADVIDPIAGTRKTTNIFRFTYFCNFMPEDRMVVPESYAEALKYLEGRRRLELASIKIPSD